MNYKKIFTSELFMQRALELADRGRGHVSPNPMVGCVIVKNNIIIGEGWHQFYGGPHAEVNAINSVIDKSELEGADLYVNLEPCAHYGKTPPCAELLVQYRFRNVFVCNMDPNPFVSGKGIAIIQKSGIPVATGILEDSGRFLNRRFFTGIEKARPYIILKWAQSSDGFIARNDHTSKWISNSLSRLLVHKWRSEEDAVMVGANTLRIDNPKLDVRIWKGRNPVRIGVAGTNAVPDFLNFFDRTQKSLFINPGIEKVEQNFEYVKLSQSTDNVSDILNQLFIRNIQSVIIEGGTQLIHSFLESNLWDEARVFTGDVTFGEGIKAPQISNYSNQEKILNDHIDWYFNK